MLFSALASLILGSDKPDPFADALTHDDAQRAERDTLRGLDDQLRDRRAARAREDAADADADREARAVLHAARAARTTNVSRELLAHFYEVATPLVVRLEDSLAVTDARPLAEAFRALDRATRERLGAPAPSWALAFAIMGVRIAADASFVPSHDAHEAGRAAFVAARAALEGSPVDFLNRTSELYSAIDRMNAPDDGHAHGRYDAARFAVLEVGRRDALDRFERDVVASARAAAQPSSDALLARRRAGRIWVTGDPSLPLEQE